MKVILLKSIPKVGAKNTIIEVASGYAQHALFPKGLAIAATPKAIADLDRQKQNNAAQKDIRHALLNKAINQLNDDTVILKVKANEQGSLFSKIHASDIAVFLMEHHRISIDPNTLTLPDGPIKKLGTYEVRCVEEGYSSTFNLQVMHQ